jgi:GNAT superfamily N-acetyltransferase
LGKIITEYSETALTNAITENVVDIWRYTSKGNDIIVTDTDELFVITLRNEGFSPQGVWYTNLTEENITENIENVSSYFKEQGQPFLWMVNPTTKPETLASYLKTRGFKEMPGTPGMYVDLEKLVDDRPNPKNFMVEEVREEDLDRYFEVYCEGYPMPVELGKIFCNSRKNHGYRPDVTRHCLGFLDGKPVATAQVFFAAGVAGLYGVTVLPEARGRGIGTEMSVYPLMIARSMGYSYAILDATQQGYGIYKRLGFRELFRPTMFNFDPSGDEEFHDRMKDWMLSERK